jgi:hypothetical protein
MNTATVTTTTAVTSFLQSCLTTEAPAPATQTPPPTTDQCPHCHSPLCADEIKDGLCWTCFGQLDGGNNLDIDRD